MDHPITEESTADKGIIVSSGQVTRGNGNESFFCQRSREVVHGADVSQVWLPIPRTVKLTVHLITSILPRQGVILCACHVPGLNTEVRSCVLDAEGKVITVHRMMSVGTVNPKKCGNESCTCGTNENGIVLPPEENDTSSIILKK
jgi:hypothetical protein